MRVEHIALYVNDRGCPTVFLATFGATSNDDVESSNELPVLPFLLR